MLLDGAAVGMAVSTKWTGFYAMLGMALCFFGAVGVWCCRAKRKGTSCRYSILLLAEGIGVYSVIPFVIYLLSFVPVCLPASFGKPVSFSQEPALTGA